LKRVEIFERDGYRCVYCGEVFAADALTVDHVQPRMKGGDRSGGNLVTACRGCNTAKGGHRLSHFLLATPSAREHFERLAVHVWPRIRRTLEEEMRRESFERRNGDGTLF
jgi:5-methylcytosine-specific restriction endonuclease McrA